MCDRVFNDCNHFVLKLVSDYNGLCLSLGNKKDELVALSHDLMDSILLGLVKEEVISYSDYEIILSCILNSEEVGQFVLTNFKLNNDGSRSFTLRQKG